MTEGRAPAEGAPVCAACQGPVRDERVNVTMWSGGRLVLIEDVPARICDRCQEQFYDERTTARIMQLAASGFPSSRAVREVVVPVFSLEAPDGDAAPAQKADQEEGEEA